MSRWPEKAVREGIIDDEGDIEKLPIGKFWRYKNPLVEQSNQMDGSMAPMIAWAFQRAALDSEGFNLRAAGIHRHAALLAKPHVGHSFFVEHPAARINHERDHEKVNGTTSQAIHARSLNGTAMKRNRFQEDAYKTV
ncbi:MAG: hypothetical protein HY846_01450 [Nitrosomonadales bacterium]|nr:hypothetical protein [Nitrosomonadales bacterium]